MDNKKKFRRNQTMKLFEISNARNWFVSSSISWNKEKPKENKNDQKRRENEEPLSKLLAVQGRTDNDFVFINDKKIYLA